MNQILASPPIQSQIDWPVIDVFFGDERCVPPDHPDSNYRMAREALLAELAVDPRRVHRMEGERADLAEEAEGGAPGTARVGHRRRNHRRRRVRRDAGDYFLQTSKTIKEVRG
jgi:6-phosphogluconolactonase/glucosamine-6-phosphate isomerase/deaminase